MRSKVVHIMRVVAALFCLSILVCSSWRVAAQELLCVNVYHDEAFEGERDRGPINAIMLANLLGHWPKYEIRVRPIQKYTPSDLEACKATLYLGTSTDPEIPNAFLRDFFTSRKRLAWVGFGIEKLDQKKFAEVFHHRVSGLVTIDDPKAKAPAFYQYVTYKGSLFHRDVISSDGRHEGPFEAVRFTPTNTSAAEKVIAHLSHNETYASIPYILRSDAKFVVGDVPFAYMHEAGRYFAFADLLFDILDEKPLRQKPLAFARTEDIHAFYWRPMLDAAFEAHSSVDVPISIAHIPLFMDPFDAFGMGKIDSPSPASDNPEFFSLIKQITQDKRNSVIWHGVTHQFGTIKNPYSGTSGDDYEFWNKVDERPVYGDSVSGTLHRLEKAMRVFSAYKQGPRFWVTPHYQASALDNSIFASVFPWIVGRVTYYPSSHKPTFTLGAVNRQASLAMPSVTLKRLRELKEKDWNDLDERSEQGEAQLFPYEIFRDVYGQRIIPETLGYLSYATTEQTGFVRSADDMLADARRNLVVRDYWASFFYHPYIFAEKRDGGSGRYSGDTFELRKLFIGLKLLGYSFVGLPEFEASLSPGDKESTQSLQKIAGD